MARHMSSAYWPSTGGQQSRGKPNTSPTGMEAAGRSKTYGKGEGHIHARLPLVWMAHVSVDLCRQMVSSRRQLWRGEMYEPKETRSGPPRGSPTGRRQAAGRSS